MKSNLSSEEKLIYLTIGLSSINSIIYFVGGLKEGNSAYTGFKIKPWMQSLNDVTEENIHNIMKYITYEYFNTTLENGDSKVEENRVMKWKSSFIDFIEESPEEHLVDLVFQNIGLQDAVRNEMPVMTFVTIIDHLFSRLDVQLAKALKELSN